MPATDREIVNKLSEKLGLTSVRAGYDNKGHLINLDLSSKGLRQLPPEIGQFTSLHVLDLGHNQLTELPVEIAQLTSLELLYLYGNQLRQLPSRRDRVPGQLE